MKNTFILVILLATANLITAQNRPEISEVGNNATDNKSHKIIFQLATDDTLAHKALMKQLNNISSVSPKSNIEVVCQGPGLNILIAGETTVQDKIQLLKKRNIEFVACEFAMKDRKITKEMMIPEAGYVPYGILEIVEKQEQGWSYIKAGF
jgi:intracellular sulfur oxidation DsrE/DsrF family protein